MCSVRLFVFVLQEVVSSGWITSIVLATRPPSLSAGKLGGVWATVTHTTARMLVLFVIMQQWKKLATTTADTSTRDRVQI